MGSTSGELSPSRAGGSFNTLAQSGTSFHSFEELRSIVVSGNGSDLMDDRLMSGRGKRKIITQKLVFELLNIAKGKGNVKFEKSLWNAFHCYGDIVVSDGRIYGRYCKTRFCTVCLANRKAIEIKKYIPELSKWESPHFVTLTCKSVQAGSLKRRVSDVLRGFRMIVERHRKRSNRGKGKRLVGVRSLECNFNPIKGTYNVHFHCIVPDFETASVLVEEWLELLSRKNSGSKHANRKAQHIRPVSDMEADLIETIKYGTKIFTEPDVKAASEGSCRRVYVLALYNILEAMSGHRLFDRFGFNLPEIDDSKSEPKEVSDYESFTFTPYVLDWVNESTGEQLGKYVPAKELLGFLIDSIERDTE